MPSQPLHLSIHDAWQTIAKAPPDRPVIFTVVGETLLNEAFKKALEGQPVDELSEVSK